MTGFIIDALQTCWTAIIAIIKTGAFALINTGLASLPAGWQTSIETVRVWLEYANSWLPLDYAFELAIASLAFDLVWFTLRIGLSVIGVKLP